MQKKGVLNDPNQKFPNLNFGTKQEGRESRKDQCRPRNKALKKEESLIKNWVGRTLPIMEGKALNLRNFGVQIGKK